MDKSPNHTVGVAKETKPSSKPVEQKPSSSSRPKPVNRPTPSSKSQVKSSGKQEEVCKHVTVIMMMSLGRGYVSLTNICFGISR